MRSSSSGSWGGKGGLDWKRQLICSSAVSVFGEPMTAFWAEVMPKRARRELGLDSRALTGSGSPMSDFQTSTARLRSRTYTHTGPSNRESESIPKSSSRNSLSELSANSI